MNENEKDFSIDLPEEENKDKEKDPGNADKEKPDIEEIAKSFSEDETNSTDINTEKGSTNIPGLEELGNQAADDIVEEESQGQSKKEPLEISLSSESESLAIDEDQPEAKVPDEKTDESGEPDKFDLNLDDISLSTSDDVPEEEITKAPEVDDSTDTDIEDIPTVSDTDGGDTPQAEEKVESTEDELPPEISELEEGIKVAEKDDLGSVKDSPTLSDIDGGDTPQAEEKIESTEDELPPEVSELEKDTADDKAVEASPEEPAESLPEVPVSQTQPSVSAPKGKKKSKAPVLILAAVMVIGAGYYFMFLRKDKEITTTKIDTAIQEKIKAEETKKTVQLLSPFVYSDAQNIQKDISDGITTYVYDTVSGLESIRSFYREKLSSLNYSLKTDDFKTADNYSHMVFAKGDKNFSIVLRGQDNKVSAVISYVE